MCDEIKSAVITGATGMIGLALIRCCIEKNIRVYAFCRKDSPKIKRIPKHNLVRIVECDLGELIYFPKDDIGKCDAFFHLGWSGTTGALRDDTSLQMKNIEDTLGAVELSRRLHCKVFIGAGSQAEYGITTHMLNENVPTFPTSGYGMAKLCAGQMSRLRCRQYGIRHVWARILSAYGPYDNENSLISYVIRSCKENVAAAVTPCEQMWDYIYCDDVAEALWRMAQSGKDGKVYCLGTGKARMLKEYLDIIRQKTGFQGELGIGKLPYPPNQVMYLCADIIALRQDLDFELKVSFDEGIDRIIEWGV